MQVGVQFPNGIKNLKHDEPLLLGRGKFGITDVTISREHLQIVFSDTSDSVIVKSLSASAPSFVWKSSRPDEPIILRKGDISLLENGDKVSLRKDLFFLAISVRKPDQTPPHTQGDTQESNSLFSEDTPKTRKRKLSSTPSFDNERPTKLRKPLQRAESSFIHPKNFIPENELKLIKIVGKGSCGEVWSANWNGNIVAVKKIFRALLSSSALKEFKSEAKILSSLRHPNVVQFWGFSQIGGDNCIVTEFMSKGALDDVAFEKELPYDTVIKFAMGAAEGVRYLHVQKPPIIHRDLKTMNFLVANDNSVKVSDFGLAKHLEGKTTQTFCGTVPWTAPELLAGKEYTTKVDVYSFGIVLWELCARTSPYQGMNPSQIILGVINNQMRPPIPPGCPPALEKLMKACWHPDPAKRPTMENVIGFLRTLSEENIERGMEGSSQTRSLDEMELTLAAPKQIAIKYNELEFSSHIPVNQKYCLTYQGKHSGTPVIIQVFQSQDFFTKELELNRIIQSPILLTTIGYSLEPKLCIVKEPVQLRSIRSYLQNCNGTLSLLSAIHLILECTKYMTVLHTWEPCCLVRNISSETFCICDNQDATQRIVCIDFSQSVFKETNLNSSHCANAEEMEYCAPELFDPKGIHTQKVDVYSFAFVMWEIITTSVTKSYQKPFGGLAKENIIQFMDDIRKAGRPMIHSSCPVELNELIQQSWHTIPEERPSFADLANYLTQVVTKLS